MTKEKQMRQAIGIVVFGLVVVLAGGYSATHQAHLWPTLFAQDKPALQAAVADPALTAQELAEFDNAIILATTADEKARPRSLGAEIADLIDARQKDAQAKAQAASVLYQRLNSREGWTLNPQSKRFEKAPNRK